MAAVIIPRSVRGRRCFQFNPARFRPRPTLVPLDLRARGGGL